MKLRQIAARGIRVKGPVTGFSLAALLGLQAFIPIEAMAQGDEPEMMEYLRHPQIAQPLT